MAMAANKVEDKKIAKQVKKAAKKAGKKGKVGLIIALSLIGVIVLATGVFAFNIFNAREDFLFPLLRDVPFISNFIPEESYGEDGQPPEPTVDVDAILSENASLLASNESYAQQIDDLQQRIDEQNQEILQLRLIQDQIDEHIENVQQFEEMLAMGDPMAFAAFFETIDPIHATLLYMAIIDELEYLEAWEDMASVWSAMRPAAAAAVVEEMINTDIELIGQAFEIMTITARSNIMNLLQPETSAAILRHMQP